MTAKNEDDKKEEMYMELLAKECFGVSFKELRTDDRLSILEAMCKYGLMSKRDGYERR